MAHQDWTPVVLNKTAKSKGLTREQEVNIARRKGEETDSIKKFLGGQNKSSKHVCPNAAKLDEDTGDYHVDRVGFSFQKALQKARNDKKMTQAQLAQLVNEKPSVINDYESGKAIPDGQVIQKLNRALGVSLPSTKPKVPKPETK